MARCALAYACGRTGARSRRTVASTTGVSSTTVASRLSAAVITAAMTNTRRSSPCESGRPRAIAAPAASNRPSSSHSLASTNTAPRNATTGDSRAASTRASCVEMAPAAIRIRTAGTAANASGQPCGRATANPRTTASNARASSRVKSAPRVFASKHRRQVQSHPVLGGQLVEDADRHVQVIGCEGQGPQRF